jgi:hypothetical protein
VVSAAGLAGVASVEALIEADSVAKASIEVDLEGVSIGEALAGIDSEECGATDLTLVDFAADSMPGELGVIVSGLAG